MTEQLLAFFMVSVAIIIIPGPDLVLIFRNAVRGGKVEAAYTAIGVMLGNAILATAAAIGLTALLMASELLFEVIRWAGAFYLMYLGVRSIASYFRIRQDQKPYIGAMAPILPITPSRVRGLRQGLFSNLLNPKVAAFYLSLFPQFDLAPLSPGVQHVVLAGLFWFLALIWYVALITFFSKFETIFQSSAFVRRAEAAAGVVLLGLGALILGTRARS